MRFHEDFISCDPSEVILDYSPQNFRGTKAYTPPEIFRNEPYPRHGADIWAMGIVLCEMVVGVGPFWSYDDLMVARLYPRCGEEVRQALLPVWYIVGSCMNWECDLRPSAEELRLRGDYLPVLLERQKIFNIDVESSWADGMVL